VDNLDTSFFTSDSRNKILDVGISDQISDVALCAAFKSFSIGRKPKSASVHRNKSGAILLKEVGLIRRNTTPVCGISYSFSKIDRKIPSLKWKRFFGPKYKQAENQAVVIAALSGTNITAFVNALDVFNDLLLDELFSKDTTIGCYTLGRIGSALNSTSRFAIVYPATFDLASDVHKERGQSHFSHPKVNATGKPTGPIKYRYLAKAKRLLIASFAELNSNGLL
jgi:hypothetical protein